MFSSAILWAGKDSNLRRELTQRIYSPPLLTTQPPTQNNRGKVVLTTGKRLPFRHLFLKETRNFDLSKKLCKWLVWCNYHLSRFLCLYGACRIRTCRTRRSDGFQVRWVQPIPPTLQKVSLPRGLKLGATCQSAHLSRISVCSFSAKRTYLLNLSFLSPLKRSRYLQLTSSRDVQDSNLWPAA